MSQNPPTVNPTKTGEATIPITIYLSKTEFQAINQLAQLLFEQFQKANQQMLKSRDIREFTKYALLSYYNLVVLKVREEESKRQKQQSPNQNQDVNYSF